MLPFTSPSRPHFPRFLMVDSQWLQSKSRKDHSARSSGKGHCALAIIVDRIESVVTIRMTVTDVNTAFPMAWSVKRYALHQRCASEGLRVVC